MDDSMDSFKTAEEVITFRHGMIALWKKVGVTPKKWLSNSRPCHLRQAIALTRHYSRKIDLRRAINHSPTCQKSLASLEKTDEVTFCALFLKV